jgi:alpha-beta hydrolase superfamily lysophospholipase
MGGTNIPGETAGSIALRRRERPMTLSIDRHEEVDTPAGPSGMPRARTAAIPIIHAGISALYQPPLTGSRCTDTAVLLVSPFGFEEICSRKFYRVMAEALAARGMPSLRFDYPGTGDGLDIPAEAWNPGCWRASVVALASQLQEISGCDRVILIGQGLGAALAYEASVEILSLAGLALLAPVLEGRSYLRELSVWSRMSEPMTASLVADHLVLGGEVISKPVTDDIRALKIRARPMEVPMFLAPRVEHTAALDLAAQLRELGAPVETRVFDEYLALVSNLTLQAVPEGLLADLAAWAEKLSGPSRGARAAPPLPPAEVRLEGPDYIETHLRLDQDRLYGILCEPKQKPVDAAHVILLNPSYEKAAGWGRAVATLARDLAADGVASLRFDMANVGDSLPREGAPEQVLYTESQQADVRAAIALMETRCPGPVIAAGRCSGAYLAFRAVLQDHRLSGAVVGNAYTLEWDPRQNLQELLLFVPQRLSSYTSKILTFHSWRKILTGEVKIRHGLINISRQILQKGAAKLKPVLTKLRIFEGDRCPITEALASISARGAAVSFLYTEGDIGLDYFQRHFDTTSGRIPGLPEVGFSVISGAEHNMLTPDARAAFTAEIARMAREIAAKKGGIPA